MPILRIRNESGTVRIRNPKELVLPDAMLTEAGRVANVEASGGTVYGVSWSHDTYTVPTNGSFVHAKMSGAGVEYRYTDGFTEDGNWQLVANDGIYLMHGTIFVGIDAAETKYARLSIISDNFIDEGGILIPPSGSFAGAASQYVSVSLSAEIPLEAGEYVTFDVSLLASGVLGAHLINRGAYFIQYVRPVPED